MMDSLHKDHAAVEFTEGRAAAVFDDSISHVPQKYRGTAADQKDMSVLGKKQVLRVFGMIR